MGEVAESPKDIFSMFNNADIRFPEITGEDGHPVQVTHGRYMSLMQSRNRQVRKMPSKLCMESMVTGEIRWLPCIVPM